MPYVDCLARESPEDYAEDCSTLRPDDPCIECRSAVLEPCADMRERPLEALPPDAACGSAEEHPW